MFLRTVFVALAGCALLPFPMAATGADRGPSTPEERKQAPESIQHFQADPLNPKLKPEIQWVVKWTMEVPDVRIDICTNFYKLPKADEKDGKTLFAAMMFAETAFVLRNPDRQNDQLAQYVKERAAAACKN